MVYIKANNEIIKVYQSVITSKKERVEWNGDIVIRKNAMILVGRLRSMYFELSSRRVYSDIEEFSLDPAKAFEIKDNILLTNIINMMLYPFVKWGAIKGIKVEKDYMVLAALFSQVFKEIDVQTYFTKTSMKFFNDEIQITFEDAMEKCIEHIEEQREDREFLEKLEGSIEDKDTGKNILEDDGGAEIYKGYTKDGRIVNINPERGIRTKAGLWHSIRWIIGSYDFKKEKFDEEYANSHRIGNNFYMVPYKCPKCGEFLHMVVFPSGKEYVIDTEEGKVYIARAYTCDNCKTFYTPSPDRLLKEGDIYILDFDNDEYAARDYALLLGRKGAKTANCHFNVYQSDYKRELSRGEKRLSEVCQDIEHLAN